MNEPYDGKSTNPDVPGVSGENTGGGNGIIGTGALNGTVGKTSNPGASGVFGLNTGGGFGVAGDSTTGTGVLGRSVSGRGVLGTSNSSTAVAGESQSGTGVYGTSASGTGVHGSSNRTGIYGQSDSGTGVQGRSGKELLIAVIVQPGSTPPETRYGVSGYSADGPAGVHGTGSLNGVFGETSNPIASGVLGVNTSTGYGVAGSSDKGTGVLGESQTGIGVNGKSTEADGVFGTAQAEGRSGVVGIHTGNGNGVFGRAGDGGFAGWFDGNVTVTGDIVLTNGADCAEDFDISGAAKIEPGTVMVIDQEGALRQSERAYDKRVAGVISGAGGYRPAIILDKQQPQDNRMPIALVGKTYCKVDAQYSSIEVGDLLTTSSTPGHAMKAADPLKAFGSVIGKALRPLERGQGLIPILIALQ